MKRRDKWNTMEGEISLHFSSDERALRMRMTCRSKSLCRTMGTRRVRTKKGGEEIRMSCVSPHGGAPKWCLKMFLVQRDNERTMARPVLQSGISSYRAFSFASSSWIGKTTLSSVRGNEPPLPRDYLLDAFNLVENSTRSKENKYNYSIITWTC